MENEEELDDIDVEQDIDVEEDIDDEDIDADGYDDAEDAEIAGGTVEVVVQEVEEQVVDIELIKRQAYEEGLRTGRVSAYEGKNNHYTGEPITDAHDLAVYELMQSIEKEGSDPITDYHKYAARARRESSAQQQAAQSIHASRADDISEFASTHADVDIGALLNDKAFGLFAKGKVGNQSLSGIYSDYQSIKADNDREISRKASLNAAKTKASPGALGTGNAAARKSVDSLTTAEFNKMKESVLRG